MKYIIKREGERSSCELMHFGVKGQKHGERRYQNPDGSLTAEGREHYGIGERMHNVGERVHGFGSKLHENHMKSIDRSAERGRDLNERGKASQLRNVGMGVLRQFGIDVLGKTAKRLGADDRAVAAGKSVLEILNLGITASRARDIHNYRASQKANRQ